MRRVWKKWLLMLGLMFFWVCVAETAYAQESGLHASAASVSSSEIRLKWNSLEQVKSYLVYRKSSQDKEFQKIAALKNTVYRDKAIQSATNYYYKVIPVSEKTGKEQKEAQAIVKAKAPAQVSIEKVTVKSSSSLKIYWNRSEGSSGYQVLRSKNEGGGYTEIARISGKKNCTYTDSEVMPGKIYFYKIRPVGSKGSVGSLSLAAKGRTIAQTAITSIASAASDRMQITWKKVSGAKAYDVYRSSKEKGGYKKVATLNGNTRKYVDRTVKSGKKYYYKIAVVGSFDGKQIKSGYSKAESFKALQKVKITSVKATADDSLKIKWNKVSGATKYKVYRASSKFGSYQKIATVKSAPLLTYTDEKVVSGKTYYYKVQAYSDGKGVVAAGSGTSSEAKGASTAYAIMGKTTVTDKQMAALFKSSGKKFPASVYRSKGAKDIEAFCKIVIDESEKEGVKGEVIFAQICLETGYLQFGGQVSAEQCNFSGLGATDDGAAGATFANVRIGIRAQVQHLKGYASRESLNQKCVDPRFAYLAFKRGSAKYVQSLGGGNWATDPLYASKLMGLIRLMNKY